MASAVHLAWAGHGGCRGGVSPDEEAPALPLQRPREQVSPRKALARPPGRTPSGQEADVPGVNSCLAPHSGQSPVSVSDPLGLRGQALRLLGVPGVDALARCRSYFTDTRRKSRRVAPWTAARRKK